MGERILHNDIKPDNILIKPDGRACLSDFGLSKDIGTNGRVLSASSNPTDGTFGYHPPDPTKSTKSDVFGVGAVYYEVITGEHPYPGKDVYQIAVEMTNKKFPSLPPTAGSDIFELSANMLNFDPDKRSEARIILNSWFIKDSSGKFVISSPNVGKV